MLALPRFGCINLHGSLLPKYRGAAPIQWAVAMGDAYTGNTTMLLEEGLDTGPILLQQTVEIAPHQTAVDLFEVLAQGRRAAGGGDACRASTAEPSSRSRRITRARPLRRCSTAKMGAWTLPRAPRTNSTIAGADFSRGPARSPLLTERSSSFIAWRLRTRRVSGLGLAQPGQIHVENHRLFAACAEETWLELIEVQLEGKKRHDRCGVSARQRRSPKTRGSVDRDAGDLSSTQGSISNSAWPSSAGNRTPTICCAARLSTRSPHRIATWQRRWCSACFAGRFNWTTNFKPLLKRPNAKLDPEILIALRMGAFQLLHLDRIPARAAIDESVELAKQAGHQVCVGHGERSAAQSSAAGARR